MHGQRKDNTMPRPGHGLRIFLTRRQHFPGKKWHLRRDPPTSDDRLQRLRPKERWRWLNARVVATTQPIGAEDVSREGATTAIAQPGGERHARRVGSHRPGDALLGGPAPSTDFYGDLLRRGGKDGRPLAPGTVQRTHVVLHRALAQAVRWDWIWVNPASQSSPPRAVPPEVRPPSPEVVTKLLSYVALRDRAFRLFLVLAATTGARRGRLLSLRWADVDLVTNTVSFQRSLVEGAAGPVLAPTKTRRSHRVALDQATADALHGFHDDEMSRGRGSRDHFVFAAGQFGERPWLPNHAMTDRYPPFIVAA